RGQLAIETVSRQVQFPAGEPLVEGRLALVEDALERPHPLERRRPLAPEFFRIARRLVAQPLEVGQRLHVRARAEFGRRRKHAPLVEVRLDPTVLAHGDTSYPPAHRCQLRHLTSDLPSLYDAATAVKAEVVQLCGSHFALPYCSRCSPAADAPARPR